MSYQSSFMNPNFQSVNNDGLTNDEEDELKSFIGKLNTSIDDSNAEFIRTENKTMNSNDFMSKHF